MTDILTGMANINENVMKYINVKYTHHCKYFIGTLYFL